MTVKSLSNREKFVWSEFARIHIPQGGPYELGAQDVDVVEKIVQYAAAIHPIDRLGLRLITHYFDWGPLLFFKGIRFTWMSDEKKTAYLKHLATSRFAFKRMSLFLFRFLVNINFYSDPRVEKAIGYSRTCENYSDETAKE